MRPVGRTHAAGGAMLILLFTLLQPALADGTTDCVTRDLEWRVVITDATSPGPQTHATRTRVIRGNTVLDDWTVVTHARAARQQPPPGHLSVEWLGEPVLFGTTYDRNRGLRIDSFRQGLAITRDNGDSVAPGLGERVELDVVCQRDTYLDNRP